MFRKLLEHPVTQGTDLDNPESIALRSQIIKENIFLRRIYLEWYGYLLRNIPYKPYGAILELGSGGGFIQELNSTIISSDIAMVPGLSVVLNGQYLPFDNESLKSILMTNVLHHIPDVRKFFKEATRCVSSGGTLNMIEPWVSRWSKWVYINFHHEDFDVEAQDWLVSSKGPLTGANGALPWIVFERDRPRFEKEFPDWEIEEIVPYMPFRYIVSGGVSMRRLVPSWSFGIWKSFEAILQRILPNINMFAIIRLKRK